MCGITGIFAFNEVGSFYMVNLAKAIDSLEKRGPDARGYFIKDFVGLGHRRLSIIDTSYGANQPFKDESGRYVLVFNGEIFNYKELRTQLEQRGHTFRTTSDTEVLLELLIREGASCLTKLIGFFAFAFYDQEKEEMLVARDRFGVKPLLYYQDEDKFIFGSEMKALMAYNIPRKVDMNSTYLYLQLNYIPGPYSIFEGVKKMAPGSYLKIKKKKVEENGYYSLPLPSTKQTGFINDYDQLKENFSALLDDSIQRRLIADVPLGAFLSGGIDSSAVVAFASRHTKHLNTFTIGFRDEPLFDERKYAALVAKKYETNHTEFELTNQDIFEEIHQVLNYLDEPFADPSSIPFYVLSKRTAGKVKVALSGDGADEILGGYNRHYAELKAREQSLSSELIGLMYPITRKLPQNRTSFWGNKLRQLNRFAEGYRLSAKDRYWRWTVLSDEKSAWNLLQEKHKTNDLLASFEKRKEYLTRFIREGGPIGDVLYSDTHLVLPGDMLVKGDMMSMACGLEVREPFLDHRLVEFAFQLPDSARIDADGRKKILRDVARELLPAELFSRPKHGFDVPLEKFYRQEFRREIERELLNRDFVVAQGIFDPEATEAIKKLIFSKGNYDQEQVWGLLVFQYWWKKWMM